MNPATQLRASLCATCGEPEDERTGLCLACLMRSATDPECVETPDIFGGERIGSYELVKEIGRGGMGVIYEARQIHTGRLVAVKRLKFDLAHEPELLARFRREAQTAAQLDHRHVLPIYEVNDQADGVLFFTMKLAVGGSLVERRAALKGRTREIATLMAKVARAADHAHQRGVLHRDLKPGNILFDAEDEPMVSDFGIAAWLHQERDLTRTNAFVGTPGYLAPEYLDGRPEVLQPTSDIYSLGVILFELLTGRLPFAAEPSLGGIRRAGEKPAPRLRTIVPHADRDLEVICARCLEIEPAMRYRSATALAEDLERWLDGRPIIARPTPIIVRGWKMVRRNPVTAFVCVIVILLLIGALTLFSSRNRVVAELASATAYDRTVGIFRVEDLDTVSRQSRLAKETTRAFVDAARKTSGSYYVEPSSLPEEVPLHRELARLSQECGARFFVSATIRHKGGIIRLAMHVTDALSNGLPSTRILEFQTEDHARISGALGAMLANISQGANPTAMVNVAPTVSQLALSYIQAGDQHLDRRLLRDCELAIDAYEKALKEQPDNAAALARLAKAMIARSFYGEREVWLAKVRPIAERSAALEPLLAEAHRTLAHIATSLNEASTARDHALDAYELRPDEPRNACAVANALAASGELDQALLWNGKAALNQQSPGEFALHRADLLAILGEFEEARAAYREFAEFRPELPDGRIGLANLDLIEGKVADALAVIRRLHDEFPSEQVVVETHASMEFHVGDVAVAEKLLTSCLGDEDAGLKPYIGVRACSALGCLAVRRGDPEGMRLIARALQREQERLAAGNKDPGVLFEIAAGLASLGRREEAIETLRKTLDSADWTYHQIRIDARLQSLREMPEFSAVQESLDRRMYELRSKYRNQRKQP